MIQILDYGSGNIFAINNAFNDLNLPCNIVNDPEKIDQNSKIILPGVGNFDETALLLKSRKFWDKLDYLVTEKRTPILGICVGMQIMAEQSEEGQEKGFGWIKGEVKKINVNNIIDKPKLPHMGWNNINVKNDDNILQNIDLFEGFYFIHSYKFSPLDLNSTIATSTYGEEIPSLLRKDHIYACQFHPEKSHDNGLQLFKNFYHFRC